MFSTWNVSAAAGRSLHLTDVDRSIGSNRIGINIWPSSVFCANIIPYLKLEEMLATLLATIGLAALSCATPTKRALARVVTSCTVPKTAALTFVSIQLNTFYALLTSFFIQDDGPWVYL